MKLGHTFTFIEKQCKLLNNEEKRKIHYIGKLITPKFFFLEAVIDFYYYMYALYTIIILPHYHIFNIFLLYKISIFCLSLGRTYLKIICNAVNIFPVWLRNQLLSAGL